MTAAVLGLVGLVGVGLAAEADLRALLLVGLAMSFSSTVFVVKVLEERSASRALGGRTAIGVLVVQDLAAVVFLAVTGAASDAEAAKGARDTANCQLVKCSWYGEDPYWGRIAAEMGAAGIAFDPDTITISYGGQGVYAGGEAQPVDEAALRAHMAGRTLDLDVDLGQGGGTARIVTTDLSHAYVDENMRTS